MTDVVRDALCIFLAMLVLTFTILFGLFLFRTNEISPYQQSVDGILENEGGFTAKAKQELSQLHTQYLNNSSHVNFHVVPVNDNGATVHYRFMNGNNIVDSTQYPATNQEGFGDQIHYKIYFDIPALPEFTGDTNISSLYFSDNFDGNTTSKVDISDTNDDNGGNKKAKRPQPKPQAVINFAKFINTDNQKQIGTTVKFNGHVGDKETVKVPDNYHLVDGDDNSFSLDKPNKRIVTIRIQHNRPPTGWIWCYFKPVKGSANEDIAGVAIPGHDGHKFNNDDLQEFEDNLPTYCHVKKVTNEPKEYIGGKRQIFQVYYEVG